MDTGAVPAVESGAVYGSWMTEAYLMEQLECSKKLNWSISGENELTALFTLNADEPVCVDGIALGSAYTLEEVFTKEARNCYRVTTSVSTDGGAATEGTFSLVGGRVAAQNEVVFTNRYQPTIPVTDDVSLMAPIILCLLAMLTAATLTLNKCRFVG